MDLQEWRREALKEIADEFTERVKSDKSAERVKACLVAIDKTRLIKGVRLN